ncbi:EAL domain-containing protein [Aquibacillus rhizosphaerae]|uniref:EAL domain-containing protein n=1 Tax=Aquibacillus rhizosphaerae TaxID=3051431 RepID=A0ABT7KZP9_9BACI|nr:EAL domain-containing protein [Aquibacillus sp. LR5S19]MDL4839022.1 EAL domain-containing protein [Aquibacillus sp. LR5S19]
MEVKVIGVLTPILDGFYYGNLLTGISKQAREYDVKVVVVGTSANYYSNAFALDYVDSWIVIMDAVDQKYIDKLKTQGKPVVGINTLLDCDNAISINNKKMMKNAVAHLIDHGHQRIAYVGDNYFYDARERFEGYLEQLKDNQIEFQDTWFYNTLELEINDIAQKIIDNKLRCTAIVCVNDSIAVELTHYFKQNNISVPEDIAIIGFDDSPNAKLNNPSLSTIHLPVSEIGERAVTTLVHDFKSKLSTIISTHPVYRKSCGCNDIGLENSNVDQSESVNYLSNMVARNFNLGQLMQSSDYKDIIDMSWIIHTPFRRGVFGLLGENNRQVLDIKKYVLEVDKETPVVTQMDKCYPNQFPPKDILFDESFMQNENVIIIIPIIQEGNELGVMAFVGLEDVAKQLTPLNTTYQLVNFFASSLHRNAMNKELNTYSHQLEIISHIMYDGIWDLDFTTKKIKSRGGINKKLGYSDVVLEVSISKAMEKVHHYDWIAVENSYYNHVNHGKSFEVECRLSQFNGNYTWCYITGQAIKDPHGEIVQMLGSIMDISKRKKSEQRINELAYQDALTGLSNRVYFEEQLILMLKRADRKTNKVALLLFDLDRFKVINDNFGHQAGDRLLKSVAERVQTIASQDYLIARIGGDEFVIAIPDFDEVKEPYNFGEILVSTLSYPFIDGAIEYHVSSSIGLSVYPDDCSDAETMMLHADIAMYRAKTTGRNRLQVYCDEIISYHSEHLYMENQLRKALERNEFSIYYQPILNLKSEEILGFEALLRWNSKDLGVVKPFDFIPVAEETGLITPIGEWVLYQACLFNKKWSDKGENHKVFVNISPRQLNHPNFLEKLKNILKETKINHDNLCLEITESAMLNDIVHHSKVFNEIIKLGVGIVMDDFGTGYSSLSLLKNFPIQMVKIDKTFIDDVETDIKDRSIVEAIVNMSHVMSLKVIAEGIETEEQMELLKECKVDFIQGFYFSKPLPSENVESTLLNNKFL